MTVVEDLAVWLTAVWDEDAERLSSPYFCGPVWPTTDESLARIAADRKILAMHAGNHECPSIEDNCGWWTPGEANFVGESEVLTPGPYCPTILLLASPHANKPGFRPEWLVERQGVEG